jgi:hypothetical protein
MPCGKLEFDLAKEDSAPANTTPKDSNALVEQQDEVPPASPDATVTEAASPESIPAAESWTKQVADVWNKSMKSLGLASPKKDQMLITDYYKVKGRKKQEKSLTTSGTPKQLSGEDGKKQKLVTDFFKSTDEADEEEAAPPALMAINVVDGKTVLEPMKKDTESTSKSSLNPLAQLKGFFSKSSNKKKGKKDDTNGGVEEKIEEKDAIEADREEAEETQEGGKQQMDLTFFGFTLCACGPGPASFEDGVECATKKEETIVASP